jgi:acyl-CoA oxidase
LEAFEARSARQAAAVALRLAEGSGSEADFQENTPELVDSARAHCQLIVVSKFIEHLQTEIPRGIKEQLEVLCNTYALSQMVESAGDFLATGYMTGKQVAFAKDQLKHLFDKIRPNAVALVDAFDHTDDYLGSALGRYDGDVYTHLYKGAFKESLNDTVVVDGYQEYLKPLLTQNMWGPQSKL